GPDGRLRGPGGRLRHRPRYPPQAAGRARRHRRDAPAVRRDRALRARPGAVGAGHHRTVTRDWDASTYERVSDPQVEWARAVLDRLPLRGDETVLDAGCGSGRVTRLLLEHLPEGRVIGVDASASMIEQAREALPDDRTELIVSDLLDLELTEPVDAVFSNATLHW